MQISKNEIQRPSLITPFFGLELSPYNDYIDYIETTNDKCCHSNDNFTITTKVVKNLRIKIENTRLFYKVIKGTSNSKFNHLMQVRTMFENARNSIKNGSHVMSCQV